MHRVFRVWGFKAWIGQGEGEASSPSRSQGDSTLRSISDGFLCSREVLTSEFSGSLRALRDAWSACLWGPTQER